MPTLHLTVHGMRCHNCTARLTRILNAAEGVVSTDIVLETGQVSVDYAPPLTEPEAIKTSIIEAGFSVI